MNSTNHTSLSSKCYIITCFGIFYQFILSKNHKSKKHPHGELFRVPSKFAVGVLQLFALSAQLGQLSLVGFPITHIYALQSR